MDIKSAGPVWFWAIKSRIVRLLAAHLRARMGLTVEMPASSDYQTVHRAWSHVR